MDGWMAKVMLKITAGHPSFDAKINMGEAFKHRQTRSVL